VYDATSHVVGRAARLRGRGVVSRAACIRSIVRPAVVQQVEAASASVSASANFCYMLSVTQSISMLDEMHKPRAYSTAARRATVAHLSPPALHAQPYVASHRPATHVCHLARRCPCTRGGHEHDAVCRVLPLWGHPCCHVLTSMTKIAVDTPNKLQVTRKYTRLYTLPNNLAYVTYIS
jgi:hypothetical protein